MLNESLLCDDDEDYDYDYDLDVSDNVEELGDIGEVPDDNSSDGGRYENIMGGLFHSGSGSSGGNISLLYSAVCFTVDVTSIAM